MLTINPMNHAFIADSYRFTLAEFLWSLQLPKSQRQATARQIEGALTAHDYAKARAIIAAIKADPPEPEVPRCTLCGQLVTVCGGERQIDVDEFICRATQRQRGFSSWLPY